MLESTLKAVDENKNITDEVKQTIKKLITKFSVIFSDVSLENLEKRIKNVTIVRTKKLVSKKPYEYRPMENELCFSLDALKNDYNADHLMMSGLLCMMTAHDNTYGFDKENALIHLNVGFTEMLSTFVVGNAGENPFYEEEYVTVNILAEIIGMETFYKAYFTNNPQMVLDKIKEAERREEDYVRRVS